MRLSGRMAIALACLALGIGLCIVSFTVRNEVIAWYSRSGMMLLIVAGVMFRRAFRRNVHTNNFEPSDMGDLQGRFLLILLRRSPAGLNAVRLEAAARSAWGPNFGRTRDASDFVESGEDGVGFVLQAHGNAFLVFETEKGVRELEPPTRAHPESAMAIWPEYSYDLSVDVAYNYEPDMSRLCGYVGR